jgi:hypothetical protein
MFADKWSKTNPYARILVPAIGLSIAAPCVFLASHTGVLGLAIFFFMLYALVRMAVDTNLMPVLCMVVDGRYKATGYGILAPQVRLRLTGAPGDGFIFRLRHRRQDPLRP